MFLSWRKALYAHRRMHRSIIKAKKNKNKDRNTQEEVLLRKK